MPAPVCDHIVTWTDENGEDLGAIIVPLMDARGTSEVTAFLKSITKPGLRIRDDTIFPSQFKDDGGKHDAVVVVEGGLVAQVVTSDPGINVTVVDYDPRNDDRDTTPNIIENAVDQIGEIHILDVLAKAHEDASEDAAEVVEELPGVARVKYANLAAEHADAACAYRILAVRKRDEAGSTQGEK